MGRRSQETRNWLRTDVSRQPLFPAPNLLAPVRRHIAHMGRKILFSLERFSHTGATGRRFSGLGQGEKIGTRLGQIQCGTLQIMDGLRSGQDMWRGGHKHPAHTGTRRQQSGLARSGYGQNIRLPSIGTRRGLKHTRIDSRTYRAVPQALRLSTGVAGQFAKDAVIGPNHADQTADIAREGRSWHLGLNDNAITLLCKWAAQERSLTKPVHLRRFPINTQI